MKVSAIVAMDRDYGIGMNNTLPWPHNKEDMKHFSSITKNSIVVMGYNTWMSLPYKLPNRINVVISHEDVEGADYTIDKQNESVFYYLEEIKSIYNKESAREVFIMGGKQTYEMLLPMIDKWYITWFTDSYACDTHLTLSTFLDFVVQHSAQNENDESLKHEILVRSTNKI